MWWRKKPAEATQSELRRVDAEASAAIAALERRVRDLELDWDQTYEKFATLYARMKKRAKAEMEREAAQEPPGATHDPAQIEIPGADRWTRLQAARKAKAGSQ